VEEVEMAKVSVASAGLPLLVEVELGRVAVTLADLARVEPGAVLPLGLARRGLVTLRLGGRELAEGELVDVDGTVGVRVLRLGAPA
jgi:type III secretion protein Q